MQRFGVKFHHIRKANIYYMEIKIKTSLLILLLTSLSLCKMGCESENVNDMSQLMKNWTRSYEDETPGKMMFRPSDFKEFTPRRYRQVIQFGNNYKCVYSVLAPNDAHLMAVGTWYYNEAEKFIIIRNAENEILYNYKVDILEKNKLVVTN